MLGVLVAFSWEAARADYPEGVKNNGLWYVCSTGRVSSGVNPYDEPECQQLTVYPDESSDGVEYGAACGPGTCAEWYQVYFVPPVGVSSFDITCALSGFVNDEGLGAGTFSHTRGSLGSHLSSSGTTVGSGYVGLAFYTYTHTLAGDAHDAGSNTHDPFYDFVANGPDSSGYNGFYVQLHTNTSGTQVNTGVSGTCFLTSWEGSYVPPTVTPTPYPTSTPVTTPTPWLGAINTPVPFATTIPWVATPEPIDFGSSPNDEVCYTLIPGFSYGPVTFFGYEFGIEWLYQELCVTEYTLSWTVFGINYGTWATALMLVGAIGILYSRMK
jgi:hypothetical protein